MFCMAFEPSQIASSIFDGRDSGNREEHFGIPNHTNDANRFLSIIKRPITGQDEGCGVINYHKDIVGAKSEGN